MAQKLLDDASTERRWREFRDQGDHAFKSRSTSGTGAKGKPVRQVRIGNPEGEKFDVKVVVSARDKLAALLDAR